jgi:hypothetical protein
MRATRDDSGWKTEEPIPRTHAPASRVSYPRAEAITVRPANVKSVPTGSEKGVGRRSA